MLNDDCRICLRANEHEDISCLNCVARIQYGKGVREEVLNSITLETE